MSNLATQFRIKADEYNENLYKEIEDVWDKFYDSAYAMAKIGQYGTNFIVSRDKVNKFEEYAVKNGFKVYAGKLALDNCQELKVYWGK